jgi:hypothetical protein
MKKGLALHAVLDAGIDIEDLELMAAVVAVAVVASVELAVVDAADG